MDEYNIPAKMKCLLLNLLREKQKLFQNGRQIKMAVSDPSILQNRLYYVHTLPQMDQILSTFAFL